MRGLRKTSGHVDWAPKYQGPQGLSNILNDQKKNAGSICVHKEGGVEEKEPEARFFKCTHTVKKADTSTRMNDISYHRVTNIERFNKNFAGVQKEEITEHEYNKSIHECSLNFVKKYKEGTSKVYFRVKASIQTRDEPVFCWSGKKYFITKREEFIQWMNRNANPEYREVTMGTFSLYKTKNKKQNG